MTDWRALLVIVRRELFERVRSRWFIAITLLGPIGMIAMVLIPALLLSSGEGSRIDIADRSGALAQPLTRRLAERHWTASEIPAETPDDIEMAKIRDRKINGYIAIPADALDGGRIVYRGDNGASQIVQAELGKAVQEVGLHQRLVRAKVDEATMAALEKPLVFATEQTSGTNQAASGEATFWLGYMLADILMLVILIYAVGVMRSVVQEKTSRVMELMVATIKPRSLMMGKIIGVGLAGLAQITVWLVMAAITLAYREQITGLFGSKGGGPALPALSIDQVAIALAFFLGGYFFYAAMYAAVGAMVSSEQDTQQVQLPITLLLIIGFACMTLVSSDPRSTSATIITMVPCWSALLMPMRYLLGGATIGEVVLSLVILIASTVLIARAAAKIYRVGVLMYGKRPGLRELIRWLRY